MHRSATARVSCGYRWWLLASLLFFAPLAPLFSLSRAGASGPYTIVFSASSNRANPVPLDGTSVSGDIYAFTTPDTPDITRVRYWLDNPSRSGPPRHSESSAPYDFAGGSVATANPFRTNQIPDGSHTITAAVDLSNGTSEIVNATFTVANSGPTLTLSPGSLTFSVSEGGTDSKTTQLQTSDGSSAAFMAADDAAWLTVTPATGSSPAELTVAVDAAGLSAGTHSATVTLSAAGYAPANLPVTLAVGAAYDQVHLAWLGDPSTTLTVVWRTWDVATPSRVEIRRQGSQTWQVVSGARRQSGTTGTLHEVTISDLTPATEYEYRVQGDGSAWSRVFSARTAPAPGHADFDFVYVADTGLIGRTDGLATGTQQVIDEIAALDPLLILPGGDYAYFSTDKRYGTLDNTIDAWFNQMQPIASRSPLMPTYGNHEVLLGEGFQAWADRFPTPDGLNGRQNYSFDVGDVHFVSILAVSNTGGLTSQQLAWIEQDILAAQAAGRRWVIPYFHVAPFADGTNHPSNLRLRAQLGPLFERLGIKLVITSHDQNYERTYPLVDVPATNTPTSTSKTCYTMADGVTWVKVSPGGKLSNISDGFSPWATNPPPHWTAFRDNTMHHFLRIRVSAEGVLRVEAFGVVGDGSPPVVQDSFEYTTGTCEPGEPVDDPPTVTIAAPISGGTVSGNVTVGVQATDNEDPAGSLAVQVQIDSGPWMATSYNATSGRYQLNWDTTTATDGAHTINARATDSASQTTNATPVTVLVDNVQEPPSAYNIVFSTSSNRTDPVTLDGVTVVGDVYVFTAPDTPDIVRVRFWLDDPGRSGKPRQIESSPPYDFAGGTVSAANPFRTTQVSDGAHTITAVIHFEDGTSRVINATFTVANGP